MPVYLRNDQGEYERVYTQEDVRLYWERFQAMVARGPIGLSELKEETK